MIKKNTWVIGSCIFLMLVTQGCAHQKRYGDTSEAVTSRFVSNEQDIQQKEAVPLEIPLQDKENAIELSQSTSEKTPDLVSEVAVLGEKKLDPAILDKLKNKTYCWATSYVRRQEPEKMTYMEQLLDQYGGFCIGDRAKKEVYLTFDEGYEAGYTGKILDVLKEQGVQAAFFVTKHYANKNTALIQRMMDEGHGVGNHTQSHPSLPTQTYEQLEEELYGFEQWFFERFGKGFVYMRPPMGDVSERVLAASYQLGYKTVMWSFAYKDFDRKDQKGADFAFHSVIDRLHPGMLLLLHAVSKDNADALEDIIQEIRRQGYEIKSLDQRRL